MNKSQIDFKAYIALVIVCVVWGTTYLANKYGVQTVPPFFFAGIRQCLAVLIMVVIFYKSIQTVKWKTAFLKDQLILGFLLITLGNGVGTAALKYLDSGIASLFATLSPVIIVILNLFFRLEGRLKPMGYLGMLLATFGCIHLFISDVNFYSSKNGLLGLTLFGICLIAWASGSLFSKKMKSSGSPFIDATIQMAGGGLILLVMSFFLEDASFSDFGTLQKYALAYSVVVGSVIAYVSFVYALSKLPSTLVSIHSYINPLIALYVGYIFLGERWDLSIIISSSLILLGVFLITKYFDKSPSM